MHWCFCQDLRSGCSVSAYLTFITYFSLILFFGRGICTLNPVVNDYNQPGIKRSLLGYDNHILIIFINLNLNEIGVVWLFKSAPYLLHLHQLHSNKDSVRFLFIYLCRECMCRWSNLVAKTNGKPSTVAPTLTNIKG